MAELVLGDADDSAWQLATMQVVSPHESHQIFVQHDVWHDITPKVPRRLITRQRDIWESNVTWFSFATGVLYGLLPPPDQTGPIE